MDNGKDVAKDIAQKMNQDLEEPKEYLIFQGKLFYGNRNKQHGILLGIVNIAEEIVIRLNLALSTAHKLRKIEPDSTTNKEFIEFFKNVSLKDRSQGVNIKSNLETKFKTISISKLLEYNRNEFESLMQEVIEDTVQERIELNLSYKLRSKSEMEEIYPQMFDTQKNKETKEKDTDNLIRLKCEPIIAPVAGKKVKQLKEGDKILVKVVDSRALYFKEELKDLKEDGSDKTEGVISNIDLTKDGNNIVVEFIPNVLGVITLDDDTKGAGIKLAVPNKDKNEEVKKGKENNDAALIYGLIILLVIIIFSLILIS